MNQLKYAQSVITFGAILLFTLIVVDNTQKVNAQESSGEILITASTVKPDLNITSFTGYWNQDYYVIVGEVMNGGQTEIEYVEVISTIYDKDNKVIGTKNTFANPSTIPPATSAPFKLSISPTDVSNFELVGSIKLTAG